MRVGHRDIVRQAVVVVGAMLQIGAGVVGGTGLIGESIGRVANSYVTPLLPAGATFAIWNVIYVAVLALAVYQLLPGQRERALHRGTGWWLAAAALGNVGWVLLYGQRLVVAAQLVLVALLVVLVLALGSASRHPARTWSDRLLVHTPIALYAGWVSVAVVVGAASTGVALGVRVPGVVADLLAAVAIGLTVVITVSVLRAVRAGTAFAAAVVWALAGIALATASDVVTAVALLAAVVVIGVAWRLLARVPRPGSAALG